MVVYVAFIAILNLALGYALAVYLGAGRRRPAMYPAPQVVSYSGDYDDEDDEYASDDLYEDDAEEEDEYEAAIN